MAHRFETRQQAIEAGYIPARSGTLETIGDYEICVTDVSGGNWFGYDFAVKIRFSASVLYDNPLRIVELASPPDECYGSTVDVSLTRERNKIGRIGAAMAMFPPGEIEKAIATARMAIASLSEQSA